MFGNRFIESPPKIFVKHVDATDGQVGGRVGRLFHDVANLPLLVDHGDAKRFGVRFLSGDEQAAGRLLRRLKGRHVVPEFQGGDVVREVHHQSRAFVVGACQVERGATPCGSSSMT